MQAKRLWSIWQALLLRIALGFTRAGRRRFVEWVTGLTLNVEEHTSTVTLLASSFLENPCFRPLQR